MSNVVQFKPRHKQEQQPVKPVSNGAPAAPVFEGADKAALTVIDALSFYAAQGFDHGERARNALFAMNEATKFADSKPQGDLA